MATAQRLTNQIAVITGAESGIGQATAIEFANEGADIAITFFTDAAGAEVTRQHVEAAGRRAVVIELDQRQPDQVERLFDETEKALGTPTILVNNAGINSTKKPVQEVSIEEWDDRIKTNLYGPFYCCRQFIQRLTDKNKPGTIINITSVHQEIPKLGASAYDASKGGLRNLTTTLALELAEQNITVNNIAPGMILTPMNQDAMDDPNVLKQEVQAIPMKRAGEPREIARAAVFLASEDARYIHGTTLTIDGGLTLYHGQGA